MSYKDELREKYVKWEKSLMPNMHFATLKLELTNICNHACITCPHSMQTRKPGFMEDGLARRLIKEAGSAGVEKAALFLNGESFLVRNIDQYVGLCKEAGISYVFLTTNGSIATEDQLANVMNRGLSSLKFSVNACDRETYHRVHGRDDFEAVIANMRFAKDYRDQHKLPCRILAGCILTDYTKHDIDRYCKTVAPLADDVLFLEPDNFAGYMVRKLPEIYHPEPIKDNRVYSFQEKGVPCPLLFNSINVTYEGYLALCCSETLNYLVVEDLNEMSLYDAWNSPRMQEMRLRHLNGDLQGTQCCICLSNTESDVNPLNPFLYKISQRQAEG